MRTQIHTHAAMIMGDWAAGLQFSQVPIFQALPLCDHNTCNSGIFQALPLWSIQLFTMSIHWCMHFWHSWLQFHLLAWLMPLASSTAATLSFHSPSQANGDSTPNIRAPTSRNSTMQDVKLDPGAWLKKLKEVELYRNRHSDASDPDILCLIFFHSIWLCVKLLSVVLYMHHED